MGAEEVLEKLLKELADKGGRAEYEPTELGLLWELERRGLVVIEGEDVELTDEGREHLGLEPADQDDEGQPADADRAVEDDDEDEPTVSARARVPAIRAGVDRFADETLDALLVELADHGGAAEFDPLEFGPLMALQTRQLVTCGADAAALTQDGWDRVRGLRGW
jgi:hypothetical protein